MSNATLVIYILMGAWAIIGLIFIVPRFQNSMRWIMHGPIIETRHGENGTYHRYEDGFVEFVDTEGHRYDMMEELYDTKRTWIICATRYGENGTSYAIRNKTYDEAAQSITDGEGLITFVDAITGLIHVRLK